jgi:hypothetical protein
MTRALTLYELAEERRVLDEFLAEAEGELTPEIEQLLTEIEGRLEEKCERVALYIREQEAQAEAVETEVKRLQARARSFRNGAAGLKRYLEGQLRGLGIDRVTGRLVTVALQRNPPALRGELTQEQMAGLFAEGRSYVRLVPASFTLDRRALLDLVKADGEAVLPDGLTVEQGASLRIR